SAGGGGAAFCRRGPAAAASQASWPLGARRGSALIFRPLGLASCENVGGCPQPKLASVTKRSRPPPPITGSSPTVTHECALSVSGSVTPRWISLGMPRRLSIRQTARERRRQLGCHGSQSATLSTI